MITRIDWDKSHDYWKKDKSMNSLEYINSIDISEYLRKQNYSFSPMQTAWLVYKNTNHTIMEKHEAYKQLINDTYNFEVLDRYGNSEGNSYFHEVLNNLMIEEKYLIERFFKKEKNTIYCIGKSYFSTAEKLMKNIEIYEDSLINIEKHYLDKDYQISLQADGYGNIYSCQGYLKYNETPLHKENRPHLLVLMPTTGIDYLESRYYYFPVPFKENDIVCTVEEPWQSLVLLENVNTDTNRNYVDESDMDYIYRINVDFYNKEKYYNHGNNYMNLQFYRPDR